MRVIAPQGRGWLAREQPDEGEQSRNFRDPLKGKQCGLPADEVAGADNRQPRGSTQKGQAHSRLGGCGLPSPIAVAMETAANASAESSSTTSLQRHHSSQGPRHALHWLASSAGCERSMCASGANPTKQGRASHKAGVASAHATGAATAGMVPVPLSPGKRKKFRRIHPVAYLPAALWGKLPVLPLPELGPLPAGGCVEAGHVCRGRSS